MNNKIDIRPDHLEIVQDILHEHLPPDVKVWAFGSRATWKAKDFSDLDLALEGQGKLPNDVIIDLDYALEESDLPWKVDLLDVHNTTDAFLQAIKQDKVALPLKDEGGMSGWQEIKIDDLKAPEKGSIAMGSFSSRIKAENFVPTGIPVIKGGNLNGDFILEDSFSFLTEEKADELSSANAFRRDIVITHRGTIGQVGIIPDNSQFERYVVSQSQLKVSLDQTKTNPYFVYYFLRSPLGQNRLLQNASQVGAPAIAQASTSVKAILVPHPDKPIQDKIVKILLEIDHKIENNRRMNETLEGMAQAVFKSWFVGFDPVHAKIEALKNGGSKDDARLAAMCAISGKPADALAQLKSENPDDYAGLAATADAFPSAFIDSPLGQIPEGWEVTTIESLSKKISKGTTLSKSALSKSTQNPSISFIKVKDILNNGEIERKDLDLIPEDIHEGVLKRSVLKEDDILFSIAGTIGRVALVNKDLNNSNANQAVSFIRLENTDCHLNLTYMSLRSKRLQDQALSSIVQGVQTNLSLSNVGQMEIIMPNKDVLISWNQISKNIISTIKYNFKNNQSLAETSDALLPKLLSGEIDVMGVNGE